MKNKTKIFPTNQCVATWAKSHPYFWKQMWVGTLSYILPASNANSNKNIQRFFLKHYEKEKRTIRKY